MELRKADESRPRARFHETLRVRFADTDAQGHVFFANYLTFFDEAFTGYCKALGVPWQSLYGDGVDIVYKASSCEHLGRAFFEDELQIDARAVRVGTTSLTLAFAAYRSETELCARGRLTCVFVSRESKDKIPVPERVREALRAYEPQPVEGLEGGE